MSVVVNISARSFHRVLIPAAVFPEIALRIRYYAA